MNVKYNRFFILSSLFSSARKSVCSLFSNDLLDKHSDLNQTTIALDYFFNDSDSKKLGEFQCSTLVKAIALASRLFPLFSFVAFVLLNLKGTRSHSPKRAHEAKQEVETGQR